MFRKILAAFKPVSPMLKTAGFGMLVVCSRDAIIENDPIQAIPAVVGSCLWALGEYCDRHFAPAAKSYFPCDSTSLLTHSLRKAADIGIMTGAVNFIRGHDTTSANLGSIAMGLTFLPSAITEIENAADANVPPLKWEKIRFLMVMGADYLAASGSKSLLNGDFSHLAWSISSLALGILITVSDTYYMKKYDMDENGLSAASAFNRRSFKLCASINLLFTLIDIVTKKDDIYTIVDDTSAISIAMLLVATTLKLRALSLSNTPTAELSQVVVNSFDYQVLTSHENQETESTVKTASPRM